MRAAARIRSWWKTLRKGKRVSSEMDEELQFHIAAYAEDLRKGGMDADAAMQQARREFGSVGLHKEECRQSLGLRLADELNADLRYGWRMLRRDRVLTAVAVLSLALGMGVNVALFSFAKAVLFDALPVAHPEELRLLGWEFPGKNQPVGFLWGEGRTRPDGNFGSTSFSYAAYQRLAEQRKFFSGVAAFNWVHKLPAITNGGPEMVGTQLVSGNFFDVLGVNALRGRNLTDADMRPDAPAVAVISYKYWTQRFGQSATVLGQAMRVNTTPVTIVGVLPASFRGPQKDAEADVVMPLVQQPRVDPTFDGNQIENPNSWWLQLLGRKLPGVSDAEVRAGLEVTLNAVARDTLPRMKEEPNRRFRMTVQSGSRGYDRLRERFGRTTLLLWALAGSVLLLACANVANLLIARATMREREMGVRLALGAGRGRVLRQMLVESGMLALLATACGLVLAYAVVRTIPAFLDSIPPVRFDMTAAWFALLLAGATALFFGLAPALQAARTRLEAGDNLRSTSGAGKMAVRKGLVLLQVALAAMLLMACGLFARTLLNLSRENLGIETSHLLLFDLTLPDTRYPPALRIATERRLMEQLETIPGVLHASVARDALATDNVFITNFDRKGRPRSGLQVRSNVVDVGFFGAAGIPVLRGRAIDERDTSSSGRVAVINSRLAHAAFPERDALGETVNGDTTIIGIVGDTASGSLREGMLPAMYLPFTQVKFWGNLTFYVRTSAEPATVMAAVRKAIHSMDADLPIMKMRTQAEQVTASLGQERLFAMLTTGFAVLSLVLGGIGVYGVTQFNVVRRTNEIGIRMALGAAQSAVIGAVLRDGLMPVCGGLLLGMGAALGSARFIRSYLYGVQGDDPVTIAGAAVLLGVTAMIAIWQPARRAARISPLEALRHE